MKVMLICRECGYSEDGLAGRDLMNKIKMWNHVSRMHPRIDASRLPLVMRVAYPDDAAYETGRGLEMIYR